MKRRWTALTQCNEPPSRKPVGNVRNSVEK
jgi:hypothetical protein